MRIKTKDLSDRTIARILVNKLFKIPLEIYKNLQTSLGEENVDFPCIYKKKNWVTYIEDVYGDIIKNIKSSDSRNFTINSRVETDMRKMFLSLTLTQTLDNFVKTKTDFFSDFIFSKECMDTYDCIGALPLFYFIIKFENFVIKNEYNVSHNIDNTFLIIAILPSGRIITSQIYGVRTICNYKEFKSGYTHSHISGDYNFNRNIWTNFCTGSDQNIVPSLIVRLKINYSPYDWLCLGNALPEMVRTESLIGKPYHHISNIGNTRNRKLPLNYDIIVESNVVKPFNMFKEMICFDFTNYITKNDLLKGYGYTATSNYVYLNIHNKAQFIRDLNKLFYEYLNNELVENSLFKIILEIEKASKKLPRSGDNFDINTEFLLKLIKDNNKEILKKVLLIHFLNNSFFEKYYFSLRDISKSEDVKVPEIGIPLVKFKKKIYSFVIKDYLTNREDDAKISLNVSIVENVLKYINLKLTNDIFNKDNEFLII